MAQLDTFHHVAPGSAIQAEQLSSSAGRRRLAMAICQRRIKPGAGSSAEFLRARTAMTQWPDLRETLHSVRWAITGGVATRAYMPERATKDLDILIHQDDCAEVSNRLRSAGYLRISALAIAGEVFRSPNGVEVDVIFGDAPWVDEALAHPHRDAAGYPILGLPYLILMKMEASHLHDLGDISRMLGGASAHEFALVMQVIARHAPDMLEDVETLAQLGHQELGA
ncbi:Sll0563 protein [Candidatus Moduliflexus flocculans]|uniref:Sll0563 protein n=1 Tax=Candidatus Moduliflexus flocculans TaxID=1499966 RepID=A0A0S6VYS0_9BACT|nr:Sll0563 protein [Candidatus Moduliflexus flocculans]